MSVLSESARYLLQNRQPPSGDPYGENWREHQDFGSLWLMWRAQAWEEDIAHDCGAGGFTWHRTQFFLRDVLLGYENHQRCWTAWNAARGGDPGASPPPAPPPSRQPTISEIRRDWMEGGN